VELSLSILAVVAPLQATKKVHVEKVMDKEHKMIILHKFHIRLPSGLLLPKRLTLKIISLEEWVLSGQNKLFNKRIRDSKEGSNRNYWRSSKVRGPSVKLITKKILIS